MNDKDQQNLDFLLNSSKEIIADWFAMMDHDEHMYALELLAIASAELHTRSIMLDFSEKQEPELEDLTMANAVLAQFLLK